MIRRSQTAREAGFTLIELIIVIVIVAILATIGIPSFRETIKNNRVTSQSNELVALLSFAKSEAIRRSETVTVQINTAGNGWTGLVEDPSGTANPTGCGEGVLRCAQNRGVDYDGPDQLNFNNRGYLTETLAGWVPAEIFLQHDGCTGARQKRRIDILATGQINSCNLACGEAICPP